MVRDRGTPIGYAKAIADYDLAVLPPHQLSSCAAVAGKHVQSKDGREFVTYASSYNPGPSLCDHLEFALKHEVGRDAGRQAIVDRERSRGAEDESSE